jgi:hypothetical protein
MSAIWHEPNQPLWLSGGPKFSFFDVAEIVEVAPAHYEQARRHLQQWQRKFGVGWYESNAKRAWSVWQTKRPWWLT